MHANTNRPRDRVGNPEYMGRAADHDDRIERNVEPLWRGRQVELNRNQIAGAKQPLRSTHDDAVDESRLRVANDEIAFGERSVVHDAAKTPGHDAGVPIA